MDVSASDRAYFERIGLCEREVAEDRIGSHLALPVSERLQRSLALMHRFAGRAARPIDDPTPLYDRARRLGFYRP